MRRFVRFGCGFLLALVILGGSFTDAAEPPLIRLGHGFAAEEQLWVMGARPDLTPNQGKKYRLKFFQFQ